MQNESVGAHRERLLPRKITQSEPQHPQARKIANPSQYYYQPQFYRTLGRRQHKPFSTISGCQPQSGTHYDQCNQNLEYENSPARQG
ncbi:MAG: hypothetical protein UZ02_AOB001000505 [Nitrosomonas europaea]|nr:MAG: hypothetical protein UZ02_AOB001000505 [Nitrosomonas europaea]